MANPEESYDTIDELLQKHSSLSKLQRVTAYVLRFIHNLCTKAEQRRTGPLSAMELSSAMTPLIRATQMKYFKEDVERLINKRHVSKSSRLLSLNPFIDEKSLLRVGGRLTESSLSFSQKHPIILPYKSDLTALIINSAHLSTLHGGTFKTLEFVRQKFWVLNGLKAVKVHLHRCITCHRHNAATTTQLMGNLPRPRVSITRPFTNSGVDYAGPFTLKASKGRGIKTLKGYVALFICLSTKAVHLEVVSDLTAQAFLAAFKRFVSRRGPVANIYSDNATNFVGASKELAKLFREPPYQDEISTALAVEGTQWHFIPPASPHFGGLWEAGIKATKHHMRRVLGETILTYEELSTLMTMIEACLNSRPLCPLNNDPESLEVLTPGHFLIGSPLLTTPQEDYLTQNVNLVTRWHILDRMHQDFWKRWSSEYLSRLQQRPKWAQRQSNVQIGNIVLIKEENLAPTRWALGRVIEIHPGNDGLVRVVTLKTKSSILKRPVAKLSLLPIIDNETTEQSVAVRKSEESSIGTEPIDKTHNHLSNRRRKPPRQGPKRERPQDHGNPDARPSPSKVKRNSFNSLLFTMIFGLLFLLASAEETTKLYSVLEFNNNQGIYFEAIADANIYTNEWTLIVHYDLSTYWKQLNTIESAVSQLSTICEKPKENSAFQGHCKTTINHLRHQLREVEDANQVIQQQNGHDEIQKIKRSTLFGFVGTAAHSLFGILDEEFAEKYEEQITSVRQNENQLKVLLQKQISIADSTLNIIKKNQQEAHQQFLAIKGRITAIHDEFNHSQQDLKLAEGFNSASLLVSWELENLRHIQNSILTVFTDTRHGKINTLLLTPLQLQAQLQIIRRHLPPNLKIPEDPTGNILLTLYSLMQVRARITQSNIIFEVRIPLLNAEPYKLYHLIPIPMTHGNKSLFIQPSSAYLLINNHRDRYTPLKESDLRLCHSWTSDNLLCNLNVPMYNLRSTASRCEMELLTLETTLSPHCVIKAMPIRPTWIRMHTANSWIFILDKETNFDIICGKQTEQFTMRKSGILQLHSGCMIKHPSLFLTANNQITGSVNSSFTLGANLPVELLNPHRHNNNETTPQLPTLLSEITSKDIDSIHSMIKDQKKEIGAMGKINAHDVHHYTSTYVLLALGIGIVILYYLHRNRQFTLKHEASSDSESTSTSNRPEPMPRKHTAQLFGV